MVYKINPLNSFERSLGKFDKQIARRILEKVQMLAENPELIKGPMSNLPKDLSGLHKVRIGDLRVFFWVDRAKLEITLYDIDKRDYAYKKLFRK